MVVKHASQLISLASIDAGAPRKDLTAWLACVYRQVAENTGLKTEVTALCFGALVILLTFGDSHLAPNVGNLDTIFGVYFWKALDITYAFASIFVFLLYGKLKNGLKLNLATVLIFLSYLLVFVLISIDDICQVLGLGITLPVDYWKVIEWIYPIYSIIAFFAFGRANSREP